jgi:predicted nucleic acid-binding protein
MTLVHLDTSFLIRALVPGSPEDSSLRQWLTTGARVAVSAVAWAEFLCGPVTQADLGLAARIVGSAVALTGREAETAADLFNRSGRRRGTFVDCLLAATALRAGAQLATANPSDFRRFARAGLDVVTSSRPEAGD